MSRRFFACLGIAALAFSGCSDQPNGAGAGGDGSTLQAFSIGVPQPPGLLIPGDTIDLARTEFLNNLFTGLIQYDPQTSEAEFSGVARSIETTDNSTFTIKLYTDWTFHDGSPVTADSFIKAWNYAALSSNALGGSHFMSNIAGYGDLQSAPGEEPKAKEMSGLRKIDDYTFTVTLSAPFAQWPLATGYVTFFPLPESFYADPEAFGSRPIGNGPWKADSDYNASEGMTMVANDNYAGRSKPKARSLELKVYQSLDTAYLDVQADNLDVARVPTSSAGTAAGLFGDRYIERKASGFTFIGFPTYEERFADKRVRQAFSMAIDRKTISEAIFSKTRAPAHGLISPVIAGARLDACKYCDLDPTRANQLLDEAGFDRSKPIQLWFNGGAGHEEWMAAVGNNLRQNLGVTYELKGGLQFAEYLPKLEQREATGPFRFAWGMDYPSAQNYLEPLYSTEGLPPGGSNVSFYSNPKFDEALAVANAAPSMDEAVKLYQAAEDIVLEDLPVVPMFFDVAQVVHSRNVSNVVVNGFNQVVTTEVAAGS